jgi:hypothetical protein
MGVVIAEEANSLDLALNGRPMNPAEVTGFEVSLVKIIGASGTNASHQFPPLVL